MSKIVLVVAAHADDEVLGCGGTIAKHTEAGDFVHVVILADGETSRVIGGDISNRENAAENAARLLGAQTPLCLGLPDNKLDSLPLLEVVQKIEPIIFELKPQAIYTHYGNDLNIDHRITHQAVMTACRPMPGNQIGEIYGFEVLSSTDWSSPETAAGFRPVRFVDISVHLERKLSALACYETEMRPHPHARSMQAVQALAAYRGALVGMPAAEGFSVIRMLDR